MLLSLANLSRDVTFCHIHFPPPQPPSPASRYTFLDFISLIGYKILDDLGEVSYAYHRLSFLVMTLTVVSHCYNTHINCKQSCLFPLCDVMLCLRSLPGDTWLKPDIASFSAKVHKPKHKKFQVDWVRFYPCNSPLCWRKEAAMLLARRKNLRAVLMLRTVSNILAMMPYRIHE